MSDKKFLTMKDIAPAFMVMAEDNEKILTSQNILLKALFNKGIIKPSDLDRAAKELLNEKEKKLKQANNRKGNSKKSGIIMP